MLCETAIRVCPPHTKPEPSTLLFTPPALCGYHILSKALEFLPGGSPEGQLGHLDGPAVGNHPFKKGLTWIGTVDSSLSLLDRERGVLHHLARSAASGLASSSKAWPVLAWSDFNPSSPIIAIGGASSRTALLVLAPSNTIRSRPETIV